MPTYPLDMTPREDHEIALDDLRNQIEAKGTAYLLTLAAMPYGDIIDHVGHDLTPTGIIPDELHQDLVDWIDNRALDAQEGEAICH